MTTNAPVVLYWCFSFIEFSSFNFEFSSPWSQVFCTFFTLKNFFFTPNIINNELLKMPYLRWISVINHSIYFSVHYAFKYLWNNYYLSIFGNIQSLFLKFGADHSLFNKCHHNIVFGKTQIRVPLLPKHICEVLFCA